MVKWAWMPLAALAAGLPALAAAESPVAQAAAMGHVAISVVDADRSAAFYTRLFGFRPVAAPVPIARWLVMANGTTLHIVANRTGPAEHSRWDHLALAIVDLDQFIARLDALHIAWTDMAGKPAVQLRPDGVRQIFLQDPDGYWIEVNDAARER